MLKALWLFGLSIGLGQASNVHVDAKVGLGSRAPVWEYPDWEGYPCHLEGQSGCPGYVKTGKVWGESQNCDKIGSHTHKLCWGYPPCKLDDFGNFVEMCQKECKDNQEYGPPICSAIEATKGNETVEYPVYVCDLKSCNDGEHHYIPKMPTQVWAPEPEQYRAGWQGWRRVPPGHWDGPQRVQNQVQF